MANSASYEYFGNKSSLNIQNISSKYNSLAFVLAYEIINNIIFYTLSITFSIDIELVSRGSKSYSLLLIDNNLHSII